MIELQKIELGKTKNILFIHGGPGGSYHGTYEFYKKIDLPFNMFFYNQNGCGKTKTGPKNHKQNLEDLNEIVQANKFDLIIGHSYGAILVYDYKENYSYSKKILLCGISLNLTVPTMNNLIFELQSLKDEKRYEYYLNKIKQYGEASWELTEKIRSENSNYKTKYNRYWCNLKAMATYNGHMKNYPNNQDTFFRVRESIHSNPEKNRYILLKEDIYHAIGLFDELMGGAASAGTRSKLFYGSAHYPHIEEVEEFVSYVTDIIS